MPEGKVAILFLEVARRSPWCRGTPAHVHWSLLRCPRSSGFSFVSPKRQRETYPSLPVLLFSSPYATDSPTSGPRLPHLGELDHLPFCARRTLWPPSPRQKRRSLSTPLVHRLASYTATTIVVFSSGSLPPPTATIPPVPPSRDIITPFYSRFIGLYQLHCRRTVCIVAACLGCRQRDR